MDTRNPAEVRGCGGLDDVGLMNSTTLVLGVIGHDAHIIGNWVLKYALEKAGFRVVNLGAAVSQKEFINAAVETNADAILVSSLMGHAVFDCGGFRDACREAGLGGILLYIGGYLVVGDQDWPTVEQKFRQMGFDRVYPPSTTPAAAIADLEKDLTLKALPANQPSKVGTVNIAKSSVKHDIGQVRDRKWSEAELLERRQKVLSLWPTGKDVDLAEAIEYHKRLPESKVFSKLLDRAKNEAWLPIVIEGGHATIEESLRHKQLVDDSGCDAFVLAHDSYTKSCRYGEAERGIAESIKQGRSMLNGYPYVNHGVNGLRRIVESSRSPLLVSASSHEEPMLSAEVGLAGGGTSNSSQALRQLLAHSKDYPLPRRIENNQYASRLAGYYTEHGAPIEVRVQNEVHSFVPGGFNAAIGILQCLLDATQGVKYLTLLLPSQYSLVYDIAMLKTCRRLAEDYLRRFGHEARLLVTPHPWHGQWPQDQHRAAAVVGWHTVIASLGGADWLHVKSVQEGLGIPSAEANVAALKVAKQMALMASGLAYPGSDQMKTEMEMLDLEIKAIVDRAIDLGDGDVAVGEVRAVQEGSLDAPMCPWRGVAGKILVIKSRDGVLRYLDHGNLPLPKQVVEYHRQKIADRERLEQRAAGVEMLIDDVFRLSRSTNRPGPNS